MANHPTGAPLVIGGSDTPLPQLLALAQLVLILFDF
jgi:hypothetical protein